MSVLAYVSGHGFGHWTRSEAVLAPLAAEVPVHVRTAHRALVPAGRAGWPASLAEVDTGPGVAQRGPLAVDVPATRRALEAHLAAWPDLVAAEVARGRELGARLVYADVPPLAFEVARGLGVPSVAMANFTWSWIYAHYAGQDPFFAEASERLAAAEGLATGLIALPGGGGLEALGDPTPELAVRRLPTRDRAAARALLPRPRPDDPRPVVLVSFGGYGDALDLSEAARANPDFAFVSFAAPASDPPENLRVLPHDHGLPHQDLVLGADALIAKPGYGTVSECLERPTPMAYVVPTDAFREHPRLVAGPIRRWLPAAPLPPDALLAGDWTPALRAALTATPASAPPPNGAAAALARLRRHLS